MRKYLQAAATSLFWFMTSFFAAGAVSLVSPVVLPIMVLIAWNFVGGFLAGTILAEQLGERN